MGCKVLDLVEVDIKAIDYKLLSHVTSDVKIKNVERYELEEIWHSFFRLR